MRIKFPRLFLQFSKKRSVCGSHHARFRFEVSVDFPKRPLHTSVEDRVAPKSGSLPWPDCPPWMVTLQCPARTPILGLAGQRVSLKPAEAGKHRGWGGFLKRPCAREGFAGWARCRWRCLVQAEAGPCWPSEQVINSRSKVQGGRELCLFM